MEWININKYFLDHYADSYDADIVISVSNAIVDDIFDNDYDADDNVDIYDDYVDNV